jgi:hypothetical protein
MEIILFHGLEQRISSLVDKTPLDNLLHLLKQPILDNIRLVFHSFTTKESDLYKTSVYDLDSSTRCKLTTLSTDISSITL